MIFASPLRRRVFLAAGILVAGARVIAGEPPPAAPTLFQTAPGRFEIAAVNPGEARLVTTEAEAAWRYLAGPLGLPDAFSSSILVRLLSAAEWKDAAPFRVIVEPGGVVSLRVGAVDSAPPEAIRRALVQALLVRLAVTQRGSHETAVVPVWLELGCVGWWETHANAAALDALKQESGRLAAPTIGDLLQWQRGEPEPRARVVGAVWLFAFLQSESTRANEWPLFLQHVLAGQGPMGALAASYPGRFRNPNDRELWWQTGWHQLRRARTLPQFDAEESRQQLAALARFVFANDDRDEIVPLVDVLQHGQEPIVSSEITRRVTELRRLVPALHPFYRNAGLSLADAFASRTATTTVQAARSAAFHSDWQDATELETATNAALDALEARQKPGSKR